jgi:hypothetical protein
VDEQDTGMKHYTQFIMHKKTQKRLEACIAAMYEEQAKGKTHTDVSQYYN